MTDEPRERGVWSVNDGQRVLSPPSMRGDTTTYWLITLLLAVVVAIKPLLVDTLDPDMFWHMRTAERLLSEGVGPLIDDFSYSSITTPWTPYSWLAEIAMHKIWLWGGYRATLALHSLLLFFIVVVMGAIALESVDYSKGGNTSSAAIATGSTIPFIAPFLSFRPITFAILVLAVIYWLFIRNQNRHEDTTSIWLIIPLMMIGINLHFFSLVTLVWLAVGIFDDARAIQKRGTAVEIVKFRTKRNCLLFGLTVAAACSTPMLPGLVGSIFHYATADPMAVELVEMRAISKIGLFGWLMSLLMLAWLILLGLARRRISLLAWPWVSFLFIITILHVRFAPILALSILPYVAFAAIGFRELGGFHRLERQILAGLILLATVWFYLRFPSAHEPMEAWANRRVPLTIGYPNSAVEFVLKHVHPRHKKVINDFNWGGYIGWRLGEKFKVFVDGRTQVYPPQFWRSTYLGHNESRLSLLRDIQADAAILSASNSLLFDPLRQLGWHVCYSDPLAMVLLPPETISTQCSSG